MWYYVLYYPRDFAHTEGARVDEMNEEQANALVLEILLSQQVDSAIVRRNIRELSRRVGGLSSARILSYSDQEFLDIFSQKPATHRFVNRMSYQTRRLFAILEQDYCGDARHIWSPPVTAATLLDRLQGFQGIGARKARVGLYLLTREFGVSVLDDGGDYAIEWCEKLPRQFGGVNTPLFKPPRNKTSDV